MYFKIINESIKNETNTTKMKTCMNIAVNQTTEFKSLEVKMYSCFKMGQEEVCKQGDQML